MNKEIEQLRKKIDAIDEQIIKLLSRRMKAAQKIGQIKKEYGLSVLDLAREKEIESLHKKLSVKYTIDHFFIKNIFRVIINFSKKIQKNNFKK